VASFRDILSLRLDDESDIMMTKEKPFSKRTFLIDLIPMIMIFLMLIMLIYSRFG